MKPPHNAQRFYQIIFTHAPMLVKGKCFECQTQSILIFEKSLLCSAYSQWYRCRPLIKLLQTMGAFYLRLQTLRYTVHSVRKARLLKLFNANQ